MSATASTFFTRHVIPSGFSSYIAACSGNTSSLRLASDLLLSAALWPSAFALCVLHFKLIQQQRENRNAHRLRRSWRSSP